MLFKNNPLDKIGFCSSPPLQVNRSVLNIGGYLGKNPKTNELLPSKSDFYIEIKLDDYEFEEKNENDKWVKEYKNNIELFIEFILDIIEHTKNYFLNEESVQPKKKNEIIDLLGSLETEQAINKLNSDLNNKILKRVLDETGEVLKPEDTFLLFGEKHKNLKKTCDTFEKIEGTSRYLCISCRAYKTENTYSEVIKKLIKSNLFPTLKDEHENTQKKDADFIKDYFDKLYKTNVSDESFAQDSENMNDILKRTAYLATKKYSPKIPRYMEPKNGKWTDIPKSKLDFKIINFDFIKLELSFRPYSENSLKYYGIACNFTPKVFLVCKTDRENDNNNVELEEDYHEYTSDSYEKNPDLNNNNIDKENGINQEGASDKEGNSDKEGASDKEGSIDNNGDSGSNGDSGDDENGNSDDNDNSDDNGDFLDEELC